MDNPTKTCRTCNEEKDLERFPRHKQMADGHINECWDCRNAYMREYFKRPDARKAQRDRSRRWRDENIDRAREAERKRYHANPERFAAASRKWLLKAKYGLTVEQYDAMLAEQGGGCAICGSPENSPGMPGKSLAVDHDHVTGKIRGLLCDKCNRAVGWFADDHEIFFKAALYIERHKE